MPTSQATAAIGAIVLVAIALSASGGGAAQQLSRRPPIASADAAARPAPTAAAGARPRSTVPLQERLRALKAEADALARQQRTVLVDLRRLEVDRQIEAAQLEESESTVAGLDLLVADTARRLAQTEAALDAAKPAIRERVVRIYKLGRLGYTRLLLDIEHARTFQRTARVVSLLARRDRAELDRYTRLIAALRADRARLAGERQKAEAAQAQLARDQEAMTRAIAAHAARVKEIEERRDLNAQLVAELIAAQDRLSQSVGQLGAQPPAASVVPGVRPAVPRFDWPLAGRVQTRFGPQANRFGTQIARNGIEIAADAGSSVRTIDAGQVAYADVFAGFGQLVIVDHGQKTYSLYGHLSTLAVQRGGAVERGQVIGASGTTPTGAPALYFELRIDGKPVDPVQWLKR